MRNYAILTAITLTLALTLTGCMAEVLTTTAITGELQAQSAGAAMGTLNEAKETKGQMELQSAVNAYYGENGYYPQSLDALVPTYFASVPTQRGGEAFSYDSSTGRVYTGGPIGTQPTAQDQQYLDMLRQAINAYAQQTGYYPGNLNQLAPYYLTSVPTASNGQAFSYNPQTGQASLPAGFASGGSARPRGGGGYGAGGPMGEAMTSIGIQNELNSMSNAGSTGAQTRGRNDINNITNDHNQRQMDTLNKLGL